MPKLPIGARTFVEQGRVEKSTSTVPKPTGPSPDRCIGSTAAPCAASMSAGGVEQFLHAGLQHVGHRPQVGHQIAAAMKPKSRLPL